MFSCQFSKENGIDVEITNFSNNSVTDVKFYTTDKKAVIEFEKLAPKESAKEYLNMENINKSDGAYTIELKRKDGVVDISSGGYYTNGGALNRKVEILIKNDSIVFEF